MRFVSDVKNWSDSSVTVKSKKHFHLDHFIWILSWFSYLQGAANVRTADPLSLYTCMLQLSLETPALNIDYRSARHRFQLLTPRETFESIESCRIFYTNSHNGSTLSWSDLCALLAASLPVIFVCVSPGNAARYVASCGSLSQKTARCHIDKKIPTSQKQPLTPFPNLQQTELETGALSTMTEEDRDGKRP